MLLINKVDLDLLLLLLLLSSLL